jgi:hypothetical protein
LATSGDLSLAIDNDWMRQEGGLGKDWRDVLARDADHLLLAAAVVVPPIFISGDDVTGVEPQVAPCLHGGFRPSPIACLAYEGPLRSQDQLALDTRRYWPVVLVKHACSPAGRWKAA